METVNLSIELPFKIGDKIWMDITKQKSTILYQKKGLLEIVIFMTASLLSLRNNTTKNLEKKLKNLFQRI